VFQQMVSICCRLVQGNSAQREESDEQR
jgi:hypothetical protein